MNTKKFRTRQEKIIATNPKGRDYIIGLDIGYSAVKVAYENGFFCFPSYAKRLDDTMLNLPSNQDILYRDDTTGEIYMVGIVAQEMLDSSSTNDTDGELFSRRRYSDKRFKILCYTALGMALADKKDNKNIIIQTGLPTSFVDGDSSGLKKAFDKIPQFSLKLGKKPWKTFQVNINPEDIHIMEQPKGALYSYLIRNDGQYVSNAKSILCSNVLILDIGFGTFDFYGVKNRAAICKETIDDLGMKQVLKHTSKSILKEMNEDIRVATLQHNLSTGTVTCVNEDDMRSEERPFAPLLETASKTVMKEAMEKAKSVTNAFRDYQYIIIDGGTGEAWYEDIKEWLSGMKTLQVCPCNLNDHLPFIYANARGYYMALYNATKQR